MAEAHKLFYIIVVDDYSPDRGEGEKSHYLIPQRENRSFRYTRPVLQSTLQLMGCKQRHAFKISKKVFDTMRNEIPVKTREIDENGSSLVISHQHFFEAGEGNLTGGSTEQGDQEKKEAAEKDVLNDNDKKPTLYKKRISVVATREKFLDVVCDSLAEYRYMGPNQRADLVRACRVRERKESMTILLCGTSGCGKSTLSSLLASRLGITTVVSTDSIRHMMRSFVDEKQNPLLWASTYHAGECLDPVAVAEAKAKKKEKNTVGQPANGQSTRRESKADFYFGDEMLSKNKIISDNSAHGERFESNTNVEAVGAKAMAIEGYKAQSEMVIDSLDRLITAWEERKQSVVVEGVHLSLNFVMGLMKKHPSIIPFMIYIANEDKHLERFAVRAKYMTLDPSKNKYVKYIRNIRAIQDYLCKRADKHLVPKVNNTNVDRSVDSIHATIFSCLRRRAGGEQLYDQATNTVKVIDEEYRNRCTANSLSSKGMFKLIQRQGSFRRLMALVNTDGSVAKAWPVDTVDSNGKPISNHGSDSCIGSPMYGPLEIEKEEPVNLQFGNFGISSWPNDTGGTSYTSSIDGNEVNSHYSSYPNSPRHSDGPAKELTEELPVPGSDEELDEVPQFDTEDDLSDSGIQQEDELQGSVDEESARGNGLHRQPFVIGVAGGTASGKTTVCEMIIQQLHDHRVVLVHQDSFYRGLTPEESKHVQEYNFDHPDAFDTEQLLDCITKLRQGQSVHIPIYDFKNHRRCTDRFRKVNVSDVIILEGILVFHDARVRDTMNMKIFVDTDADVRLARRIRRDTVERGRDVNSVLEQYAKFVKPAFDDFVMPSKKYADVIIPRGGDNHVAINLIVQHIETKLEQHDLCKIYPNVFVIQTNFQIRGMHTLIRDRQTTTHDFVFYSDRLIRLVVENGLGHLPFTEKQVITPTDSVYTGVDFCKKLCGVSIIRSGESMENALRACCKGIKIGKILIHRDGDNGKQLIYEKLPSDISERHVLLLDPVLATGNSAGQAIELLIQKGVPESHIIFLNLISAPEGIHTVCKRFPRLKIVTSEIDLALNEEFRVVPGMGEFGDRYFGTYDEPPTSAPENGFKLANNLHVVRDVFPPPFCQQA